MEHLDFVLWMLFFPITWEVSKYVSFKIGEDKKKYSDSTEYWSGLFIVFIWFFVGYKLF